MPIHYSVKDRIAEIVFDHPPVNAFDTAGWGSIPQYLNAPRVAAFAAAWISRKCKSIPNAFRN
jgi:hypothetical protein